MVHAAPFDDVTPDGADGGIGGGRANEPADRVRAERRGEALVGNAELRGVRLDLGAQHERNLAGERSRHRVDGWVGMVGGEAGGIGEQVTGRTDLGGSVGEPLAVHLLSVDPFAAPGPPARHRQRLAHQRIDGRDQSLDGGQIDRLRHRIRHEVHSVCWGCRGTTKRHEMPSLA